MINEKLINGHKVYSDTVAKTVTTNGVTRPMTTTEIQKANALNTKAAAQVNQQMLLERLTANITALKTLIGSNADPAGNNTLHAITNQTNAVINSGPAPYIKALTKAQIDIAKAVVQLSRIVAKKLDTTD